MPILPPEPDAHPENVLDLQESTEENWWLFYTRSRQEKQLMRRLRSLNIKHYAPQIPHRKRSPAGRVRTTYAPLFNNYVFMLGTEDNRYKAVCTGCIVKNDPITDTEQFIADLKQVHRLVNTGAPLTVESRIEVGETVRVRSGAFSGYEGIVIRRDQETRLVVSVQFMERGVSVKLEDCQLESIA
ncbi:KOW motif-containing protein [bacterium]|nr:KOW motif-containing protein [bacterium]MDB4770760.1 KOW motif-containing protein [bacterium]